MRLARPVLALSLAALVLAGCVEEPPADAAPPLPEGCAELVTPPSGTAIDMEDTAVGRDEERDAFYVSTTLYNWNSYQVTEAAVTVRITVDGTDRTEELGPGFLSLWPKTVRLGAYEPEFVDEYVEDAPESWAGAELEALFTLDVREWCTPLPPDGCTAWAADGVQRALTVTDQKLAITAPWRGEDLARVSINLTMTNNSLRRAVHVRLDPAFTLNGEDVTGAFVLDHYDTFAAHEILPAEFVNEAVSARAPARFVGEDVEMTLTLTADRWCA